MIQLVARDIVVCRSQSCESDDGEDERTWSGSPF